MASSSWSSRWLLFAVLSSSWFSGVCLR
jgi:hypothetical protein